MGRREIAELASKVGDNAKSIEHPAEQLAVRLSQLKLELENIDQMSQIESLRLQITMDRLARITTVLANLTSSVRDTEDAIRKHLK
jgi:hypothetical protein